MKVLAVLMAGGSGERFWPLSKKNNPKQFLSIIGTSSMLQQTVKRLEGFVTPEDTYIVTLKEYKTKVIAQLPGIPEDNILEEPYGRDTAAAVGLATINVSRKDPGAVMVMLPTDHFISNAKQFLITLKATVAAASKGNHIVTVGIPPERPETGYGYIQKGNLHEVIELPVFKAIKFIEKPSLERALSFVNNGNYFWNSGIFVWRVDLIRHLIDVHLPELGKGLKIIENVSNKEKSSVISNIYSSLPNHSIDYGILEKVKDILVIEGAFGWDDVGSWTALERLHPLIKENGNVIKARGVFLDTQNTTIVSQHRVVATMGVMNLIIVDDGHHLLICDKNHVQKIKKLTDSLKRDGFEDSL